MNEYNSKPAAPDAANVYASGDPIAQADALLAALDEGTPSPQPAQAEPIAQADPGQAPQGYQLAYVQTPEGYRPAYVPVQPSPGYAGDYSQPGYAQSAPATAPQPSRARSEQRAQAPRRPANAVKPRPRKKPWGKILGASVLSAAVIAVVVWAVVAGASALIRRMGGDRRQGGYDNSGWNSMGGYDNGGWNGMGDDYGSFGGSLRVDADGNLVDENGNIIGNINDGGYIDENGNTIIISPINPDGSQQDSSAFVEGDFSYHFVHAEGGLNLREAPDGDRIATIPNGYPVRLMGWQGQWFLIAYEADNDTLIGWVNGDYISTQPLGDSTRYYVHAGGGLNMRIKPSTAGDRVLTIPEGEVVYAAAYYDDWVFVSYQGQYGWVSGDYISTSASKPTQPSQGNTGSDGYTMADVEKAMDEARAYYRSRKGKAPSGGLRDDSLTDTQVEQLYWDAVGLVVGMEYFPAGQFENVGEMLQLSDGYGMFYQVSDPQIRSMEDWADLFYSVLTDDLACDLLCASPMFILDGKMYISGDAMGDEGLATQYSIRVEPDGDGYKLIMDVVNIREDYYTGTSERMEWSFTAHCFKEDGVWVFDDADTPYR